MSYEFKGVAPKDDYNDPLATKVINLFNQALFFRSTINCGTSNLKTVLRECYEQKYGLLSADELEIVESLGIDLKINLTQLKASTLEANISSTLLATDDLPFLVKPTPIPELSKRSKREALSQIKQEIFINGTLSPVDLLNVTRGIKDRLLAEESSVAEQAADKMNSLIKDQCIESGFRKAMKQFLHDACYYPFAVMHGPYPVTKKSLYWNGSSVATKIDTAYEFECVSPFDFFWTPDSNSVQNGTAVFIRERKTKKALYDCLDTDSYIKENVLKVLENCATGNTYIYWASRNYESGIDSINDWLNGGLLDVIKCYGVFLGSDLQLYGIKVNDPKKYYEACISVVDGLTIQAYILPVPTVYSRPVYTTSFEKLGNNICGSCIPMKLRDVERAYVSMLRLLIRNAGFASAPITEVDYSRIQSYISPDDIGKILPGVAIPVESTYNNHGSAYRFTSIPSNVSQFMSVMEYFMGIADKVTNIPASMHGQPVGTGANRTFRGMSMLQSNSMKPIELFISNLDEDIFGPLGTNMYYYNMQFNKDESIKGDCKVVAVGASGMLQKEMAKQQAIEVLSVIGQAGQALGGIDPRYVIWSVNQLFSAMGLPIHEIETMPLPQANNMNSTTDVTPDQQIINGE